MRNFVLALFLAIFSFAGVNSVCRAQKLPQPSGQNPNFTIFDERRPNINEAASGGPSSEPRVLKKGPLAPSEDDRTSHAGFLTRPNTGLIRLLPRQFKQSKFYREPPVKINGGGAYYSFAHLNHEYGFGSDLELGTGVVMNDGEEFPPYHYLQVGFAGYDFGMLSNLGQVPLERLTFDDPRTVFLREYKAPHAKREARGEARRFHEGVTLNGQTYKSMLPIQVGATYLLRSINYDESDILVAFRVVREDTDESLIIAWQMLKRFSKPQLN